MVMPPKPDMQCLDSPYRLGTDNIPVSGPPDRASTIVNIQVYTVQNDPVAWLYTTQAGLHWLQIKTFGGGSRPMKITSTSLSAPPRATLHECFSRALKV